MPTGSITDLLLAKAKPISDSGSASGIAYLRRRKKALLQNTSQERAVRICERNYSADIKISEKGGAGGAPGTRAQIQPLCSLR
ncbi:unnamed protein product, partial [Bubo scandiacus]